MKNLLSKGFIGLLFVSILVGLSAPVRAATPVDFSIASGSTSGVYFPLGAAFAKALMVSIPDAVVVNDSTRGSVDNINLVASGRAGIGFSQADTAWDGYKGYGQFSKPMPIRAIAVFYPESLQLVTLRDSGIAGVNDLRGKRLSTGPSGSGTEIWANRLLTVSDMSPGKDLTRVSMSLSESVVALKENRIDAFFWGSGVPTKAIAEFMQEPGSHVRLLETAQAVPQLLRKFGPVYTDGVMPAKTYVGQVSAVKTVDVWTLLVVHADMDEKLVYLITKALFENKPALVSGHVMARHLDINNQRRGGSPIPFHSGARRYLMEQGVRILR